MIVESNINELWPTATDDPITAEFVKSIGGVPKSRDNAPRVISLNQDMFVDHGVLTEEIPAMKEAISKATTFKTAVGLGHKTADMLDYLMKILLLLVMPCLFFVPTNVAKVRALILAKKGNLLLKRVDACMEELRKGKAAGGEVTRKNLLKGLSFFANYNHMIATEIFDFPNLFARVCFGDIDYESLMENIYNVHCGDLTNIVSYKIEPNVLVKEVEEGRKNPFCRVIDLTTNGCIVSEGNGEFAYWKEIQKIKKIPNTERTIEQTTMEGGLIGVLSQLKAAGNIMLNFYREGNVSFDYQTIGVDYRSTIDQFEQEASNLIIEPITYENIMPEPAEKMDETDLPVRSTRVGMKMFEGESKESFKVWFNENKKFFVGERNTIINRKTKEQHTMTNRDAEIFKREILDPNQIVDDMGMFFAEMQMVGCLRELDPKMESEVMTKKVLYSKDGKVKKKTITYKDVKYEETVTDIPISTGRGVVMTKRVHYHNFYKACMLAWKGDHKFEMTRKYLEIRLQNSIIRSSIFQSLFFPRYNDTLPLEWKDNNILCLFHGSGNIKRHQNYGIQSAGIGHGIEKARQVGDGSTYRADAIKAVKRRIINDNQAKLAEMVINKQPMPAAVVKGMFKSFLIIPPISNNTYRSGIYMPKLFFSPYGHFLSFMKFYEDRQTVVLNREKNILWKDIEYLIMTSYFLDDLGVMEAGIGKTFKRSDIKQFITEEIRVVSDEEFRKTKYIPPLRSSGHIASKSRGQVFPILKAAVKRPMLGDFTIFDEDIKNSKNSVGGGFESYESIYRKLMRDVEEHIKEPKELCGWVNEKVITIQPKGEFFGSDYQPKKPRLEDDIDVPM